MKQCICVYCPNYQFKSTGEVQRHQISYHLGRYSWSCAALTNPEDAIIRIPGCICCCSYCGLAFQDHCEEKGIVAHLIRDHRFGGCNREKEFFQGDRFRRHLIDFHGALQGPGSYELQKACMKTETSPSERAVATSVVAMQTPSALQSATVGMTKLPVPHAQDEVPPPLPPPTYITETSTTPESDGQSANRSDIAGRGDLAAVSPGSRIPDERLDSLHLVGVTSDDSVVRKHRMSLPVSESAKEGWWTLTATPVCNQAMAAKSKATEHRTKSPSLQPRSTYAAEERKSESLHVCSTCQRSFARRTILVNHERTHTGEKPFSCTFMGCSKTFAQQGDKTRHEQAQHTEKTFRCGSLHSESPSWGCGKKFRRKDGLLEHHSKTMKGKQCLADRDKLMELGRIGDEDSLDVS